MQQIESLYGYCLATVDAQRPFTACKLFQIVYCESLRGEWENSYFCE